MYGAVPKMAFDLMATVSEKLGRYRFIAAAWSHAEEKISLEDWLNDGVPLGADTQRTTVFMTCHSRAPNERTMLMRTGSTFFTPV